MPDATPDSAAQTPPSPARRSRRPLLIAHACVAAGSGIGAVALPGVVSRLEPAAAPAEAAAKPTPAQETPPKGVPLEKPVSVMVNVADENARRVLKADIVLEAQNDKARAAIEERLAEVKNLLISVLSEKRLHDLEGKEAKDGLRREIKLFINERLGIPDAIVAVYFDQFIIQ